jgi:hypothetical protein
VRALITGWVMLAAGGVAYYQLTPEQKPAAPVDQPPIKRGDTQPEVKPDAPAPVPPADLVPIRAILQPGLPAQVTLTIQQGLPSGLILNAGPIGPYQGWAGFDAGNNCTHFVYHYDPFPGQMSSSWFYGVVRGNGLPASLPGGALVGVRLVRANPATPLPLVAGHMVPFGGVASPAPGGVLPFAGQVLVQ